MTSAITEKGGGTFHGPEIANRFTETRLAPEEDFRVDLKRLVIPDGTTLAVIVNPNNPNGGIVDVEPLRDLLIRHPRTRFLVDEAFIGLAGETVVDWVPEHSNLLVTRTLSKAHSLAGFRVGYGVFPEAIADDLNAHNDAYPLSRPSQAAAIATLQNESEIRARGERLRVWTGDLAKRLADLGARVYPTETYFFLADFAPHDASDIAEALAAHNILVKPLNDPRLGPGYMRITTALPEANEEFVAALEALLEPASRAD